jgi:hypothetical protein
MRRLSILALGAFVALPALAFTPGGRLVLVEESVPFTVLGTLALPRADATGMMNPTGPKGCPPRCFGVDELLQRLQEADPKGGRPPLAQLGILLRPGTKQVKLERLALVVAGPGDKLLMQTDDACGGCGTVLPPLANPKAGYLFRLDDKAIEMVEPEYGHQPLGLRVDSTGELEVLLVRLD